MRGNFPEIIAASWEWTRTILFRPFQIKKWLVLGFIALLAGQFTYGANSRGNINLPKQDSGQPAIEETTEADRAAPAESVMPDPLGKFFTPIEKATDFNRWSFFKETNKAVIIFIIVFLFFIFTWLYSRFSFIFLEAIVKNDASVKMPFHENKSAGNSYFLWNVIIALIGSAFVGLLGLAGYLSLSRIGIFSQGIKPGAGRIILAVLPVLLTFIVFVIIAVLLNFVVRNFILPVMYKDKVGILKAWPPVLSILKEHKGSVSLYLLIKVGLFIAAAFLAGLAGMVISIGLILPAGSMAGMAFLGYKIMPDFLHPAYLGLLVVIGLPLLLAAGFCFNCLFLPLPVFFQTFNLKFLARIEERYDLFNMPTAEVKS